MARRYLERFPAQQSVGVSCPLISKTDGHLVKTPHHAYLHIFKDFWKCGTKMLFKYQWGVRVHCWQYQLFPNIIDEDLRQLLNIVVKLVLSVVKSLTSG